MKQDFYEIHKKLVADASPAILKTVENAVSQDVSTIKLAIDLRSSRRHAGLTQSQLAAKAGITQSELSRIEKGVYSPRLATLIKLARSLQVDFVISGTDADRAKLA
jgi:predicted transcriptional regulator